MFHEGGGYRFTHERDTTSTTHKMKKEHLGCCEKGIFQSRPIKTLKITQVTCTHNQQLFEIFPRGKPLIFSIFVFGHVAQISATFSNSIFEARLPHL